MPKHRTKKLLVIDDNQDILELLKDYLKMSYKVFVASSVDEALDVLELEKINLIICDVLMPKIDGIKFIAALQESRKYRALPVIIISAYANKKEISDRLGGIKKIPLITKPIDFDLLEKTIAELENKTPRSRLI